VTDRIEPVTRRPIGPRPVERPAPGERPQRRRDRRDKDRDPKRPRPAPRSGGGQVDIRA
jgi:hypothetical protein